MTQRRILVFVLLLSAFAISFAILTFDVLGEEKAPEVYDVSLIVRGKTGEQWESIKQGADQAASEMNVDLSFITLSEENNLREQISLIQREYDSGVDAIVLAAADSNGLVNTIERVSENIPVVCIESTVNSAAVKSYISADNYAMGVQLGQEIVRSGNARKRLAVVESSTQCSNVQQRRAGLMSVLGEIGGEVVSWTLPDDSAEAARTLAQELRPKSVDVWSPSTSLRSRRPRRRSSTSGPIISPSSASARPARSLPISSRTLSTPRSCRMISASVTWGSRRPSIPSKSVRSRRPPSSSSA